MKKNLLFILVISILGWTFISCSKDDEEGTGTSNSLIVGKWQLVSVSHEEDYEPCEFEGYTEFKEGGVWTYKTGCDNGAGTWKVDNENLTITPNILPIPVTVKIITLNETTLITALSHFNFDDNHNLIEAVYKETYKRIK